MTNHQINEAHVHSGWGWQIMEITSQICQITNIECFLCTLMFLPFAEKKLWTNIYNNPFLQNCITGAMAYLVFGFLNDFAFEQKKSKWKLSLWLVG